MIIGLSCKRCLGAHAHCELSHTRKPILSVCSLSRSCGSKKSCLSVSIYSYCPSEQVHEPVKSDLSWRSPVDVKCCQHISYHLSVDLVVNRGTVSPVRTGERNYSQFVWSSAARLVAGISTAKLVAGRVNRSIWVIRVIELVKALSLLI